MTGTPGFTRPAHAIALFVFAHGAGAGMRHRWMEGMAAALAERRVASWRYDFPYMAAGKRRVDPPAVAQRAVRDAVTAARAQAPDLPLVAGGKSFGGRMTSQAEADAPLGVRGLLCFGWPLHPPGAPGTQRAVHLAHVTVPMLFVQGTRDPLARLELLEPVLAALPTATLALIERGDHSLERKRGDGTGPAEAADRAAEWIASLLP